MTSFQLPSVRDTAWISWMPIFTFCVTKSRCFNNSEREWTVLRINLVTITSAVWDSASSETSVTCSQVLCSHRTPMIDDPLTRFSKDQHDLARFALFFTTLSFLSNSTWVKTVFSIHFVVGPSIDLLFVKMSLNSFFSGVSSSSDLHKTSTYYSEYMNIIRLFLSFLCQYLCTRQTEKQKLVFSSEIFAHSRQIQDCWPNINVLYIFIKRQIWTEGRSVKHVPSTV